MLVNQSNQAVLAENVEIADAFWRRFLGLMGRSKLGQGQGLLLKPCNSVHTCFMRFSIDVIFLNPAWQIVHIETELAPYKISKIIREAVQVIELPSGTINATGTKAWDYLTLVGQEQFGQGHL